MDSEFEEIKARIEKRAAAYASLSDEEKAEKSRAEQKRREEEFAAERQDRVNARLATIPPRYRTARLEQLSPVVKGRLESWIERLEEDRGIPGLLFAGPTGVGKTHAMWAVVRELYERDWLYSIYIEKVVSLLTKLRPGGVEDSHEYLERLTTCGLLCLDDLAVQKNSDWVTERLYEVVDTRYDMVLPVIVTTNLPLHELATSVDDRLVSRLYEMCEAIEATGKDRRKE